MRFMTSCPQMMNFDGKDELKKPYDHPYLPVRLFSIKPIKEDILIVGVDSSTNEVLQTWILSVRISFEEVIYLSFLRMSLNIYILSPSYITTEDFFKN